MTAKISHDDFLHIAKLSRLPIAQNEEFIADQLSEAAAYVDVLNQLELSNIVPTYQVNGKSNVFRPDQIIPSFSQSQALSQAPQSYKGYFRTSPTIKKNK